MWASGKPPTLSSPPVKPARLFLDHQTHPGFSQDPGLDPGTGKMESGVGTLLSSRLTCRLGEPVWAEKGKSRQHEDSLGQASSQIFFSAYTDFPQ